MEWRDGLAFTIGEIRRNSDKWPESRGSVWSGGMAWHALSAKSGEMVANGRNRGVVYGVAGWPGMQYRRNLAK